MYMHAIGRTQRERERPPTTWLCSSARQRGEETRSRETQTSRLRVDSTEAAMLTAQIKHTRSKIVRMDTCKYTCIHADMQMMSIVLIILYSTKFSKHIIFVDFVKWP